MRPAKLQTIEISKRYPGTTALQGVSISFQPGQVHALIGKNGAGKSTLVKILSGAVQPSSGKILLDQQEVQLKSPKDALHQGIATVYQELSLVPGLTVGENILLGRLPRRPLPGGFIVDWPRVFQSAESVLERMKVGLDVRKKAGEFGMASQQVIEIAKAMSYNPSVLILDEPTSALAHHETQNLFGLIRQLTAQGVAVLYISHRLQELQEIADTVSVLRDAKLIGTISIGEATPETIAQMMFGEIIKRMRPANLRAHPEPVMEVRHLSRRGKLEDICFTLHKGEILGIAGMVGSGRTELLRAIFGADSFDEGEIILAGQGAITPRPALMKACGVGLTPESRKEEGLVQVLTVRDNLCLASLGRISLRGLVWKGRQQSFVDKAIGDLHIAVSSAEQVVSTLSGGNQQKVVVGNWLNTEPRIMFFDEPTRGIDVQAKQQIFQIIWDLSRRGISSIFVSTELEELVEVCHRILIMRKGRIVGEVSADGLPIQELLELCMEE